jgi:hypothetical protein
MQRRLAARAAHLFAANGSYAQLNQQRLCYCIPSLQSAQLECIHTKLGFFVNGLTIRLLFLEERCERHHIRENHARVPSKEDDTGSSFIEESDEHVSRRGRITIEEVQRGSKEQGARLHTTRQRKKTERESGTLAS